MSDSMHTLLRLLLLAVMLLIMTVPVGAQDATPTPAPNPVTDSFLSYGQTVTDTITDQAIFDLWTFEVEEGDQVVVTMQAFEGLRPLLGLLDENRSVTLRSDRTEDGAQIDAEVNGIAQIQFTAPRTGFFTVNATRVGTVDGTSTGSYSLTVARVEDTSQRENPLQEVEFRCGQALVTTAATIEFADEITAESQGVYRISLYGIDGFQPVLRIDGLGEEDPDAESECVIDSPVPLGDSLVLWDGEIIVINEAQQPDTLQTTLTPTSAQVRPRFVIGSRDGSPGRYILVIEGLRIEAGGDEDYFLARLGPLAREREMLVYMVASASTRLDPIVSLYDENGELLRSCDDAGRRACEDVPGLEDLLIAFAEGNNIEGDRLDAGLRLAPGTPEIQPMLLSVRNENTEGDYAIVIVGELPARAAPENEGSN